MEAFTEIFIDALLDSLKMLPFLFVTYLFLEYVEHKGSAKFAGVLQRSGRLGPIGGAVLGCIPQCGFSVAAANLYAGRIITAGTLVAVFVSTSDEAIPLLIANPESAGLVLKLMLYKVIFAVIVGFLLDFILRRKPVLLSETDNKMHSDCHNVLNGRQIVLSAVKHTLYIFVFVFAVLLVLNVAIYFIGEDRLSAVLMTNTLWQPLIAGVLGLVPNCAPSVILTQLYISGGLSFGALFAGLSTAAGMGMVLLFKNNHNLKQNLLLIAYIYAASVLVGIII